MSLAQRVNATARNGTRYSLAGPVDAPLLAFIRDAQKEVTSGKSGSSPAAE